MIFLVLMLLSSAGVYAYGVTAPYWKEKPLILKPGQSAELTFELQNMVGESDLQVQTELIGDRRYAALLEEDKIYELPKKTQGVPVKLKITVPNDLAIGTSFPINIMFRSMGKTGSQQVQLGMAIEKSFTVWVGEIPNIETPAPRSNKSAIFAGIIIFVAFILWLWLRKSRKGKAKNQENNARW